MNNYSIYLIRHLESHKVYVGLTSRPPKKRWDEHRWSANAKGKRKKHYLHNAITKHGISSFEFTVILTNLDRSRAAELEKSFIAMHKSTDLQFGYNFTLGGESVILPPDKLEERNRSIAKSWEDPIRRQKASERQRGRKNPPVTEETRIKQRDSHLGKKLPEEQKIKISLSGKRVYENDPGRKQRDAERRRLNPPPPMSEENRRKISLRTKGRKASSATRQKQSEARKGILGRPELKTEDIKRLKDLGYSNRKIGRILGTNHHTVRLRLLNDK